MKWKVALKKSDDLIKQLLFNRKVENRESFFHPKISDFEKDLNITGIDKAQKRILQAIKNNESIIVYGDYDVDGICGCAILYKSLTSLGAKVLPYIPHREKEGYGLSKLGLDVVKSQGASLVITVDNGIVATSQAKYAKKIGLDLIITDHHIPTKETPDVFAIVHSTKMCGAAVAWCLIRNMIKKDLSKDLLQFVALATVCDLMPLLDLNRALVVEGLKVLNATDNLGLLSLIQEAGLDLGEVGSYEIGHVLGPRLNAAGRIEHAIDSLRLLCTKDPGKAKRLAKFLSETNATRQKMTADAIEEAILLVDEKQKIHVLASKDWPSGIIGLVAGRVTEKYFRPTIAISEGKEVSKGSARSVSGINIIEVIRKHSDILIDVGGHPGAAGFSILSKHIEIFKERLEKHVIELPEQEKVLEIDAEVKIEQITKKLVEDLQQLQPFGFGNPRPVFASYDLQISDIRTVGEGKHLKGKATGFDFIAFGMGDLASMLSNGQPVDLAYTPEIDHYQASEKLQLKVKDIKL